MVREPAAIGHVAQGSLSSLAAFPRPRVFWLRSLDVCGMIFSAWQRIFGPSCSGTARACAGRRAAGPESGHCATRPPRGDRNHGQRKRRNAPGLGGFSSNSSPRTREAAKENLHEEKHLAQRRKDAEAEKTKQLFIPNLSASASLRDFGYPGKTCGWWCPDRRPRQGKGVCCFFPLSKYSRLDFRVSRVADGPFGSIRVRALRSHFSAFSNWPRA